MKDPEWFWGLGNPQDYWYKGITFIIFSFFDKIKKSRLRKNSGNRFAVLDSNKNFRPRDTKLRGPGPEARARESLYF